MSEEESAGETAYEHNMRVTNAIGQHVDEVDKAVTLLKRSEYQVFTKKEFKRRITNLWGWILASIMFAFISGFLFCWAFVKGG